MKNKTWKIISGLYVQIMLTTENEVGKSRRSRLEYRAGCLLCFEGEYIRKKDVPKWEEWGNEGDCPTKLTPWVCLRGPYGPFCLNENSLFLNWPTWQGKKLFNAVSDDSHHDAPPLENSEKICYIPHLDTKYGWKEFLGHLRPLEKYTQRFFTRISPVLPKICTQNSENLPGTATANM